jgi:hypothetical protein
MAACAAYVSVRQRTSAYVSIREHTSARFPWIHHTIAACAAAAERRGERGARSEERGERREERGERREPVEVDEHKLVVLKYYKHQISGTKVLQN